MDGSPGISVFYRLKIAFDSILLAKGTEPQGSWASMPGVDFSVGAMFGVQPHQWFDPNQGGNVVTVEKCRKHVHMNTNSFSSIDRRRFLKTSAIATVAAGTGLWLCRKSGRNTIQ